MENKVETKTKKISAERILTWSFFLVIIAVVVVTFFKYFALKDYYILAETDCDPAKEKCFATTCDPATDDSCSQNPDEQTSYYKLIKKKAYLIPICDPNDENCPKLACSAGEDCEETLCDEQTVKDQEGAECNDPEVYNENIKSQEDSVESSDEICVPEDENCSSDENADDSSGDSGAQNDNNASEN